MPVSTPENALKIIRRLCLFGPFSSSSARRVINTITTERLAFMTIFSLFRGQVRTVRSQQPPVDGNERRHCEEQCRNATECEHPPWLPKRRSPRRHRSLAFDPRAKASHRTGTDLARFQVQLLNTWMRRRRERPEDRLTTWLARLDMFASLGALEDLAACTLALDVPGLTTIHITSPSYTNSARVLNGVSPRALAFFSQRKACQRLTHGVAGTKCPDLHLCLRPSHKLGDLTH